MMLSGVELTCPRDDCRVTFEVHAELREKAIEKGQSVYCPNGHSIIWNGGKSRAVLEAEKRAEEAERQVKREREWRGGVEEDYFDADRRCSELAAMLRRCPICGHRSRKIIVERARAELVSHLVGKHGIEISAYMEQTIEEATS